MAMISAPRGRFGHPGGGCGLSPVGDRAAPADYESVAIRGSTLLPGRRLNRQDTSEGIVLRPALEPAIDKPAVGRLFR